MSEKLIARHSSFVIPNYEIGDCPQLENELSVYNARFFRRDPIAFIYNEENKELRIPGGFMLRRLAKMLNRDIADDSYPNPADKLQIKIKNKPRDDKQLSVIKFLCGLGDTYKFSRKYSQLFCDLRTRFGKTYCAINAISYYGEKALILVSSRRTNLIEQWRDEFLLHSDIDEKDILLIRGSKMCLDIIANKYKDKSVFIMGRASALGFAKKYGWDEFERLIAKMKVGTKIFDEAHEDTNTLIKIDCYSNVKRTFYFTSSAARSDHAENKIFKKVFAEVPIMGSDLITQDDNYLVVVVIKFSHVPTTKQRLACKTIDGLSSSLYSAYLIDKDGAKTQFFTALHKAMTMFVAKYRSGTSKVLILGSTREILNTIGRFLKVNFPDYTIGVYTSDIVDRKKRELELENDIILSTDKSAGTGVTIDRLQIVINLIPYSSPVLADQLSGRLSWQNDGIVPLYIEIVNEGFTEAIRQYDNRSKHLCRKAKDGKIITVTSYCPQVKSTERYEKIDNVKKPVMQTKIRSYDNIAASKQQSEIRDWNEVFTKYPIRIYNNI